VYKEALRSIEGIQIYPLISLTIFGLFFISLIIWVMKADKEYIHNMSHLPLTDDESVVGNKKGAQSHV
jgi:fructose-specific phosphotransferase system IIC component